MQSELLPLHINKKLDVLKKILLELENVAVAFSGGVDSTLLLYVASRILKDKAVGIYFDSVLIQKRERMKIRTLANNIGAKLIVLEGVDLSHGAFVNNPDNRCYYCKGLIFDKILECAKNEGIYNIVDGSNWDDTADYRPGKAALNERKVRSPLQEAELTKDEIRLISKEYKLPTWDKDALACLATRIPHGTAIDKNKLELVDGIEEFLVNEGFREVRARLHSDYVSIEVRSDQVNDLIVKNRDEIFYERLKSICTTGFRINEHGYKRGNLSIK